MKNLVYLFIVVVAFLAACGNTGQQNEENGTTDSTAVNEEVTMVTVTEFLATPEKWANEKIKLVGTVSHTCKHSGKKMFIFDDNSEKTVKINAGGEVTMFDVAWEGSDVEVIGKVVEDARIDEQYLNEWEEEINQAIEDGEIEVCTAENEATEGQLTEEGETTEEAEDDPFAPIKKYRKQLAESGKPYISYYAVECINAKELKN